ncbi:DUF7535 family protein [Haloplanus aerogenes]|uniref:Uncharacterized protein n=1 Tax=Haloplanus aerogenes TaxID=660522 RepID=A0A3M0DVW0_9EURY|nr:hypothetical protein [Haloplanus aerogenes]AZH24675.1 hypothetical protein DU502_04425 [Haloplanus aerogenes]RMB23666.1 hypothetical protein ATH50_0890 [Haloplanus aerogenes]
MSDAESADEPALDPAKTVYRTLGKPFRAHADAEMDAIGWSIFLGMMILLLPLMPFLLLIWLVTKVLDAVAPTED